MFTMNSLNGIFRSITALMTLALTVAVCAAPASTASAAALNAGFAQVEDEQGVLIVSVQKDSPAANAGLRRSDIVLKVNEAEVNDAQTLGDEIRKLKPGDEAQVLVSRGDSEITLKIELGDADGRAVLGVTPFQNTQVVQAQPAQPGQQGEQSVTEMDPKQDEAEETHKRLEEQVKLLTRQGEETHKDREQQMQTLSQKRFVEVTKDSPAAEAGLKQGDIILSVDGKEVNAGNNLEDVVKSFEPNDEVILRIERDDQEQELKITLGENPDKGGAAIVGVREAPEFSVFQILDELALKMPQMPPLIPGSVQITSSVQMITATIAEVVRDSPAAKAGLKQGDIITSANDLMNLINTSKPGDRITLSVTRQGEDKPVEVTLGENPEKQGAAYMGVSLGQFIMPGIRLRFDTPQQ